MKNIKFTVLILVLATAFDAQAVLAATGPKAPIGGKLTCRNIARLMVKAERRMDQFTRRLESVIVKYESFAERYETKAADKKARLEAQRAAVLAENASCFDGRPDINDDSRQCKRATQKAANIAHRITKIRLSAADTHKSRVHDNRLRTLNDRIDALVAYTTSTLVPFHDECAAGGDDDGGEGGEGDGGEAEEG